MHNYDINDVSKCVNISSKCINIARVNVASRIYRIMWPPSCELLTSPARGSLEMALKSFEFHKFKDVQTLYSLDDVMT